MADFSVCRKRRCGHRVEGLVAKCPACGARMETSRRMQELGGVMLACGVFLVGVMGYVAWAMYPTMAAPGKVIDGSIFTGTPEQARMFFGMFLVVIVFGLLATANGLWQIVTARRNRIFTIATLVLAALLLGAAWLTIEFA